MTEPNIKREIKSGQKRLTENDGCLMGNGSLGTLKCASSINEPQPNLGTPDKNIFAWLTQMLDNYFNDYS